MKRLLSILPLAVSVANAQCVMCFRTAAAQQMERAKVLNFGIIIMMIPPIVIVAVFLYQLWRKNSVYAESAWAGESPAPPRLGRQFELGEAGDSPATWNKL